MNSGQEQFYNYIIGYTKEEKLNEVKELLEECFKRQDNGTFDAEFLKEVTPKILEYLKEEHIKEVEQIMNKFGSAHTS